MVKAATHGAGRPVLVNALRNREPFKTSGALYAETSPIYVNPGMLSNADDLNRYRADRDAITYVVYSYATPIAWVANGEVYIVSQRFSVTTSKHQGFLYNLTY